MEKIIFDDFLTKEGEFKAVEIELKTPPVNAYLTAIYNYTYAINTPSQVIKKLLPSVILKPEEAQKIEFFSNEMDCLNEIFNEVMADDLKYISKINANDYDLETKELIFEYDKLRFHICPKIEDMYLLSFGFLECEAYNLDIELEMIKRYIELFNQGEDLSKIDEMLDNEFEESVGMLEKYMGELDLAIERKDTHFELSEDDLDSLNSLYLDLIYK